MARTEGFCSKCGTPMRAGAAFCHGCGAPRKTQPTRTAGPTMATVARTVSATAGMAGMGAALPWQTIVAGQQPDIRAFLSAAALPAAHQAVRASLKRPGIAMAVTTTLDLLVAGITRGTGGLVAAIPRVLLGGATALFSLVTGSKGGQLRKLTGTISAVTAVVQLGYTGWTVVGGLLGGTPVLTLLPMAIAMTSSLVMAVKTVLLAFRRNR